MNKTVNPGKPLLNALAGSTQSPPPVWLMRQAGRYLPEYREVRREAGDFVNLCLTPDLAIEVTLQPVRRYGLDAAIIFSDILLLPFALGASLQFVDGSGPVLSRVRNLGDVHNLGNTASALDRLAPVYAALRGSAGHLPDDVALIGFAGSPWTVATYMVLGRGKEGQVEAREFAFENPLTFDSLLELLIEGTTAHLIRQAEAGAEVLMLFDSWAGLLTGPAFERYVTIPNERVVRAVRESCPGTPIIAFPRGAGSQYTEFFGRVRPDCLAVDTQVDPAWIRNCLQPLCCVQGNVDPRLLVAGGNRLYDAIDATLAALSAGPYIFNLGHGILPETSPEHVSDMIVHVRNSRIRGKAQIRL